MFRTDVRMGRLGVMPMAPLMASSARTSMVVWLDVFRYRRFMTLVRSEFLLMKRSLGA